MLETSPLLTIILLTPLIYFALHLFRIICNLWIWILKRLGHCHLTLGTKSLQKAGTCSWIIFTWKWSDNCITCLIPGFRSSWLVQIERGENRTSETSVHSLKSPDIKGSSWFLVVLGAQHRGEMSTAWSKLELSTFWTAHTNEGRILFRITRLNVPEKLLIKQGYGKIPLDT